MGASRILVVEDNDAIRLALRSALRGQGFEVGELASGDGVEARLAEFAPELVVLDVMLPGGRDGFDLLPVIRAHSRAGVLMLTARDTMADRVRGLAEGADDYLVKPFAMVEAIARCHAILRRTGAIGASVTIGELTIADEATRVSCGGVPVELTATERRILALLTRQVGRVVPKSQLLTSIWGYHGYDANVVEVHVSTLRRKLERYGPRVVHTVRGEGYRLGES
ncbi:DNA-binding response regulator [Enemella evansiae]|uniref:DNA-binding response regulator n=1 Tax=Enemella evansiae TaxID=2016499 RepID=A0A255GID0_9ACTN|nr:response regulator transcription factor [Enemella evansiae]OYO12734.1 DNA-binding response regulator [Enemella evansiae]